MKADNNIDEIRDTLRVLRNRHANEDATLRAYNTIEYCLEQIFNYCHKQIEDGYMRNRDLNKRNTQLLSKIQELEAREQ
jgi:hypothetical protein